MPVCPQCDNRQFSSKEALMQHMRSSSAYHPSCDICDRRFVSQTAYDAHVVAKHPPTYNCIDCDRKFQTMSALDDHYRGTNLHPNCTKCGGGFKDLFARDEHHRTAHPKSPCAPCGDKYIYDDEFNQHYWDSTIHPKCHNCKAGFKDDTKYAEHMAAAHPLTAHNTIIADVPIADSQNNIPQEEPASVEPHMMEEIIPQAQLITQQISQNSTVYSSTGFTPLSPRNHIQNLIIGDQRINSPDLRLELGFSPIIDAKPPFSPTSLPRPGGKIEELWNTTENVQIGPSRFQSQFSPPSLVRKVEPYTGRIGYHTHTSTNASSSSSWLNPAHPGLLHAKDSRQVSPPPRVSPPQISFHPRLYPGSARAASMNYQGPPIEVNFASSNGPPRTFGSKGPASLGGSLYSYAHSYAKPGPSRGASSEIVNWEDLMGKELRTTLFRSEIAFTPKPEMNELTPSPSQVVLGVGVQLDHSPSLATISSPTSSALGHSPNSSTAYEPETRPTTASSTPSRLPLGSLTFTVTPNSECPSPMGAPDLSSPISLASLPSMSPLAATPIDIPSYDIPEAKKPLPESPTEALSPAITAILDLPEPKVTKLEDLAPLAPPSASPLSASSSQSYITSPQEPAEASAASPTLKPFETASAVLETETNFDLYLSMDSEGSTDNAFTDTAITSPATPVASEPLERTLSGKEEKVNPNPLHCRACLADSCDDITASMCGHIFCNRCITDAVIKTSRCPVCMTPTLLYCLFRLDLGA